MAEAEGRAGYDRRAPQAVPSGEIAECLADEGIDAGLPESRAAGARRPMRAEEHPLTQPRALASQRLAPFARDDRETAATDEQCPEHHEPVRDVAPHGELNDEGP